MSAVNEVPPAKRIRVEFHYPEDLAEQVETLFSELAKRRFVELYHIGTAETGSRGSFDDGRAPGQRFFEVYSDDGRTMDKALYFRFPREEGG